MTVGHKKSNRYLAAGSNAADENEEDDSPGKHEAAEQLPADSSHVLDTARDLQHVVPETLRKTRVTERCFILYGKNLQFKFHFILEVNILTFVRQTS